MRKQEIVIDIPTKNSPSHCMFEWVYFANPVSDIDSTLVHDARTSLGEKMANQVGQDTESEWDIIVPVPDTSRISAQAIGRILKKPMVEAIIKNRYMHRTFIMQSPGVRSVYASQKYLYVKSLIKDKRILLVDDSIVRGLTSKLIVKKIFSLGAKTVGFSVTCPPIQYPCYYGVDFSTQKELIASNRSISEIEEWLGATKLYYLTLEDLKDGIKQPICSACITGNYPTKMGKELAEKSLNGQILDGIRHYEQLGSSKVLTDITE